MVGRRYDNLESLLIFYDYTEFQMKSKDFFRIYFQKPFYSDLSLNIKKRGHIFFVAPIEINAARSRRLK